MLGNVRRHVQVTASRAYTHEPQRVGVHISAPPIFSAPLRRSSTMRDASSCQPWNLKIYTHAPLARWCPTPRALSHPDDTGQCRVETEEDVCEPLFFQPRYFELHFHVTYHVVVMTVLRIVIIIVVFLTLL